MKTSKSSRPLCHRGRCRTRRPAADTSRTASPLDVNSSLLTADELPVRPTAQPGTTPTSRQSRDAATQEVVATNPSPESMDSR